MKRARRVLDVASIALLVAVLAGWLPEWLVTFGLPRWVMPVVLGPVTAIVFVRGYLKGRAA